MPELNWTLSCRKCFSLTSSIRTRLGPSPAAERRERKRERKRRQGEGEKEREGKRNDRRKGKRKIKRTSIKRGEIKGERGQTTTDLLGTVRQDVDCI